MSAAIPAELEAEFLRIPDAVKFSGVSRSVLYRMIKDGSLPSKNLRAKGAIRGIRLISKHVLRDVLNAAE